MTRINQLIYFLILGILVIPQAQAAWFSYKESVSITAPQRPAVDRVNRAYFVYVDIENETDVDIPEGTRMVIKNSSLPVINNSSSNADEYYIDLPAIASRGKLTQKVMFSLQRVALTYDIDIEKDGFIEQEQGKPSGFNPVSNERIKISEDEVLNHIKGIFNIRVESSMAMSDVIDIANQINGSVSGFVSSINLYQITVPLAELNEDEENILISHLENIVGVVSVSRETKALLNYLLPDGDYKGDTELGKVWDDTPQGRNKHLEAIGFKEGIDFLERNGYGPIFGGKKHPIGIFDTGLDSRHPDLLPIGSKSGDLLQHGTMVAGIISATWNDEGVTGIMGESKVLFESAGGGGLSGLLYFNIISSLEKLLDNGSKVVNLSVGASLPKIKIDGETYCIYPKPLNLHDRIDYDENPGLFILPLPKGTTKCPSAGLTSTISSRVDVRNKFQDKLKTNAANANNLNDLIDKYTDRILVFSAGNNNLDAYYGGYGCKLLAENPLREDIFCVGGSSYHYNYSKLDQDSNFGDAVNIIAPFEVFTTKIKDDELYSIVIGTSFSAPLVTGTIGLLWNEFPELSSQQIFQAIKMSGYISSSTESEVQIYDAPHLNVYHAAHCALSLSAGLDSCSLPVPHKTFDAIHVEIKDGVRFYPKKNEDEEAAEEELVAYVEVPVNDDDEQQFSFTHTLTLINKGSTPLNIEKLSIFDNKIMDSQYESENGEIIKNYDNNITIFNKTCANSSIKTNETCSFDIVLKKVHEVWDFSKNNDFKFEIEVISSDSSFKRVPLELFITKDPVVTLIGDSTIFVNSGSDYLELGAKAFDGKDGALAINIEGVVNTDIPGEYEVTYYVEDSDNNTQEVTRTIIVNAAPIIPSPIQNKDFYVVSPDRFERFNVSFSNTAFTVSYPSPSIKPDKDGAFTVDSNGEVLIDNDGLSLKIISTTNTDYYEIEEVRSTNGEWSYETEWMDNSYGNGTVSALNNDINALKDLFLDNGLWEATLTADGRIERSDSMVTGKWWIEGNVFYFDYPDLETGSLDHKAYRIYEGTLYFATDAKYSDVSRFYFEEDKANAYLAEIKNTTPDLGSNEYDMVSAGYNHTCMVHNTKVICWGDNSHGQVIDNTLPDSLSNTIQVGTGYHHSCALDQEVGVKCWGDNTYGQLNVPDLINPTEISVGGHHSCALDDTGLKCWGYYQSPDSIKSLNLINPTKISAGGFHSCVIDNGKVLCWSGSGPFIHTDIPELNNPTEISAGSAHSCILGGNGVQCWGNRPQVPNEELPNIKQISAGGGLGHFCAIGDDYLRCYRGNQYGFTRTLTVDNLSNPKQVSSGLGGGTFGGHVCALDDSGVICWGDDTYGQTTPPSMVAGNESGLEVYIIP